jgi:protein-S-isoprenylcysteine O-methyltransferase Ste14
VKMNRSFLLTGITAICILTAALMFIAGRKSYWQAWVFGAVNLVVVFIMSRGLANKSDIYRERMRFGKGTKWWDALFLSLFGPMNLAIIVVAALDAGRFRWTSPVPAIAVPAAYILYILAAMLHLWAVRSNRFYISTVRVLKDRSHRVVDRGPYRYMRHPGYTGIILMVNAIAIVLGSIAALVPSGIVTILVIGRTCLEDAFLKRELVGYAEYANEVNYRLIPRIW